MINQVLKNRSEISKKHYVRKADPDNDYWVDFSRNKLDTYKEKFGSNFCLIVAGSEDSEFDFYQIPFSDVEDLFVDRTMASDREERNRWIANVLSPHRLRVWNAGEKDIEAYYGAISNNEKSTDNWSKEELEASVRAYLEMRDLQDEGQKFVKKRYYEKLSQSFDRTTKAFEYRMQNISYVFTLMGRNWVTGLKPAKNVGTNVIEIIERLIYKLEDSANPPIAKFQSEVTQIRKSKNIPRPSGSKNPTRTVSETTSYARDPRIVAWILEESKGICECCDKPAPFNKTDGDFYLEVHHLKRLADKGSDTITNAVALCPNCHREMHYGENRDEILNQLYSKIDRLIIE